MHLSQTPLLFVMTHFQFSKMAPPKMNSALRGRRKACARGGRFVCVCDSDLGWGGETCGGILFNKKACFVLLLNVNEQYKGKLDVHLWGIRQHRSIGGMSVWIEVTLCLTKEVPLTGSPSKCSGALSESRGCGGGRRPDSHISDPRLVGAAGLFVRQHVYSQLVRGKVYVWHWRSLCRINNLMRCDEAVIA